MNAQVDKQERQIKDVDLPPVLPDSVPVTMPTLPTTFDISTEQQFKAISDTTRSKILGIVQNQTATAKQIADRLGATPGAIGHHLHVLEEAGLVQIVARRLVRGIVANYYTRTARIFMYNFPREVAGEPVALDFVAKLREEMIEAMPANENEDGIGFMSFPHVRISRAKAEEYARRLQQVQDDLLAEPPDPDGEVFGVFITMFKAPAYVQGKAASSPPVETDGTSTTREAES